MAPPVESGPQTVLLVESEPLLLRFISRILSNAGFRVLPAKTAEEALRIESTFAGVINLLVTSFTLPTLSGPKLAQELSKKRGMPVMLMSGYPDASRVADRHSWSFTEKPIDIGSFLNKVKTSKRS